MRIPLTTRGRTNRGVPMAESGMTTTFMNR
jgi:hypothetical protein